MTTVVIPSGLREHCDGLERVEVEAESVRNVLKAMEVRFPGFRAQLGENAAVAIDGEVFQDPLYEAVGPNSVVHFLPALSGGQ